MINESKLNNNLLSNVCINIVKSKLTLDGIVTNVKEHELYSSIVKCDDLDKLLKSLEKSTYSNYEVIIVENNSKNKETFEYYDKIIQKDKRIKVFKYDINYFNYSAIVNYGVECSNGEYIVMLNNDIEFITTDWMEQMLMYAQRPDVGICGAKLYFPDKTIQHAGVTIGTRGLAGHRNREISENLENFFADPYPLVVEYFNPESYYIDNGKVVIYFQQYDIAPYSSGIRVFEI